MFNKNSKNKEKFRSNQKMNKSKTTLEAKSRFNISMAPSIKNKVDIAAKDMGMSASAFITMCVSNYFIQQDSLKTIEELKKVLNSVSDLK